MSQSSSAGVAPLLGAAPATPEQLQQTSAYTKTRQLDFERWLPVTDPTAFLQRDDVVPGSDSDAVLELLRARFPARKRHHVRVIPYHGYQNWRSQGHVTEWHVYPEYVEFYDVHGRSQAEAVLDYQEFGPLRLPRDDSGELREADDFYVDAIKYDASGDPRKIPEDQAHRADDYQLVYDPRRQDRKQAASRASITRHARRIHRQDLGKARKQITTLLNEKFDLDVEAVDWASPYARGGWGNAASDYDTYITQLLFALQLLRKYSRWSMSRIYREAPEVSQLATKLHAYWEDNRKHLERRARRVGDVNRLLEALRVKPQRRRGAKPQTKKPVS